MASVSVRPRPTCALTTIRRDTFWTCALRVLEDPELDPIEELATDRPSPELMHVAARRAPHLIDRQIGDAPTAPTHVQIREDLQRAVARRRSRWYARPLARRRASELAGLVRRVTELATGGPRSSRRRR